MIDITQLKGFYTSHLKEVLLPFWLDRSIDYVDGGYFTCFDNMGEKLLSTNKYTWSQGRMVWIFSKLAAMGKGVFTKTETANFLELAALGARFLMKNCLLPNGNCTFVMDKKGRPVADEKSGMLDTSFFADCFVITGLAKYAEVSGEGSVLEFSLGLYESVTGRLRENSVKMEPYPVPEEFRFHGVPMIMINTAQELLEAAAQWEGGIYCSLAACLKTDLISYIDDVLNHFIDENAVLHEMVRKESGEGDTVFDRYVNPGHAIEDMWFIIRSALGLNRKEYISRAGRTVKKMLEIGWDAEYGGLLLFADKEGGRPSGSTGGLENTTMMVKIREDWDSKLWWPHCEALYSTLLLYYLTEDYSYLQEYSKLHDYTFGVFPNHDRSVGEWIQIRDRSGDPVSKVVALPVKDPFHILRTVIQILELEI